MPTLTIDNSPATFRFNDSNPLSDGMAQFAAAVMNAGPAAARIRQQRENDSVARAFQQAQSDRADRSLDLQSLWHRQANDMHLAKAGAYQGDDPALTDLARQVKLAMAHRQQMDQSQLDRQNRALDSQENYHQAQIANLQADNARAALGQLGDGLNEAIKRGVDIVKLFKAGGSAQTPRVFKAADPSGRERFYALDENGQMRELPMRQQAGAVNQQGAPGTTPPGAAPVNGGQLPPSTGQIPAETVREKNLRETGYPDREFTWYNPRDWFRSPPAGDQAPRIQEWVPVLSNRQHPGYQAAIQRLAAWRRGFDPDTGKPFPEGPAWAQSVLQALDQAGP